MPRKQWNDGQEVIESDLGSISSALELELYDRLIYELMNRQRNVFFGDGFLAAYVGSVTSQVNAGSGMYYDSAQTDPEPKTRLLFLPATTQLTHDAAHASLNRIDIIVAYPTRAVTKTGTRNKKNAISGVVSAVEMDVETDWRSTIAIVAGTPGASPLVPATPAASVKLAEVLVTAATGITGASAYTDKRTRHRKSNSWVEYRSVTSAYTADQDDCLISANAASGAFAITLPLASLVPGKVFEICKIDSSGNAVTVQGDTISDAVTQVISAQWTTLRLRSNGSQYLLI